MSGEAAHETACRPPGPACFAEKHEGHDVGWRHEHGGLYSATCHDCGEVYLARS